MKKFWQLKYNLGFIPLIYLSLRLAGLFNAKIREGIRGRRKIFENLIINSVDLDKSKPVVWFHSSSMGEFEQAKPIIQRLKTGKEVNIIVTFFSPSGYKNSLNYPYADIISYLPFDTKRSAKKFISFIKPNLAVFMRYDIWPNMIWELSERGTPVFIVDATMRKNSRRKLPFVKNFHKYLYRDITRILAVSDSDVDNFMEFNLRSDQIRAVGDTRFDRVYQKSQEAKKKKILKEGLLDKKKVFVFGSSWDSDEELILPALMKMTEYEPDFTLIIAPHEPSLLHLDKLEDILSAKHISHIRFSYLNNYNGEKVIIVDSIGILLTLYYYAEAAFVGGSFKQGIHNVLEPAVYGIPVFFGPKIENSQEAQQLVNLGSGIITRNKREAYRSIRGLFSDSEERKRLGNISLQYVEENTGATEKILSEIYNFIRI
jgi:3-deoxy-D-manno-octulosonic-acid transferase